jgi:hypothetical protein
MGGTSQSVFDTATYQDFLGAPGRIRTCDARFRNPVG